MKKLLLLGAALFSLCAVGQTARAGDDGPSYSYDRSAPRYYEGRVVERPCYYPPPPPPVYYAPPVVAYYGYPRYHRRHFRPYGYGYPYGYAPGVRVGVGF